MVNFMQQQIGDKFQIYLNFHLIIVKNPNKMISGRLKQIFLILLPVFFTSVSLAQEKQYSLADTLRGSLRTERICYDVKHYDLWVDLDTINRSLMGKNTLTAQAVESFTEIQIDLFDNMMIDSIVWDGISLKYNRLYHAVFVRFPRTVAEGSIFSLTVYYHGSPLKAKRAPWDGGFVWTKDKTGAPWIAVACEGTGASLWWPNKDHLSDEPDSADIHCTVPDPLDCICNGQDFGKSSAEGKSTHHWKVSYPINNYNITLNAGRYVQFSDSLIYSDGSCLRLDYRVISENLNKARKQFEQVKPMMQTYDRFVGHYPFMKDGYRLVETPYLGMEHQSAIAYGNQYKTGYNGSDYSKIGLDFDYIIIHETGHEWWGNAVSCRDIADMWIHESFCTYMEALYVEGMFGKDTAFNYINAKISTVDNKKPIVGVYGVNEEGDGDMYNKGMLFLNTLRHIAGDDQSWFKAFRGFYEHHKYKTIGYDEVVRYFSAALYTDLSRVFEQYLKYPSIPVLQYILKKGKGKNYTLFLRWKADVAEFSMPITLILPGGKTKRLEPEASRSMVINISKNKKENVQFDQRSAYFNVEQVKRF